MYQIKEIPLKNGAMRRKSLAIYFDDPAMAIVGEFLMADAPIMNAAILNEIDGVLDGETDDATSSGNRCKLEVKSDKTLIYDLFDEFDGVDAYLPCEIDTRKLRALIVMWLDELAAFKKRMNDSDTKS
ncbi:hypothetical protein JOC34_004000 [Virgibacillus halotolerans]|uniref:hypothetical protein n=1 Tax=Virgibacillus halotolerans TaxID=1071053 RepID=UPI001961481E|nr:hypothetical protein [Virgibacillus halotolerans]MBM7601572.1 hypothetical protein [Virgibacillus halotolerans]